MKKILFGTILLTIWIYADFSRDNGVVTDNRTILQWQDDYNNESIKEVNWTNAITYCETLFLDGGNWRLPNINELTSLVDDTKMNPSIDNTFQNTVSNGYWSSTSDANRTNYAWLVHFNYGYQSHEYKRYNGYVRCVRAGE